MDASPDPTPLIVLVTAPDRGCAEGLAAGLVERRLAACVNLIPNLTSVYRWKDRVEQAEEMQLVIKTTAARLAGLEAFVRDQHPYDVPELIAVSVAYAEGAYLDWWRSACRGPGPTA